MRRPRPRRRARGSLHVRCRHVRCMWSVPRRPGFRTLQRAAAGVPGSRPIHRHTYIPAWDPGSPLSMNKCMCSHAKSGLQNEKLREAERGRRNPHITLQHQTHGSLVARSDLCVYLTVCRAALARDSLLPSGVLPRWRTASCLRAVAAISGSSPGTTVGSVCDPQLCEADGPADPLRGDTWCCECALSAGAHSPLVRTLRWCAADDRNP